MLRSIHIVTLMIVSILCVCGLVHANVQIQIDYSYDTNGFFSSQERQNTLSAAADFFESVLGDDLQAITPGGVNSWSISFTHPATGDTETIDDPSIAADTLVFYAGGQDLSGALGFGGPGGWSASGTQEWIDTVRTRGESGVPDTDFALWGGMMTFDSVGTNWYFDQNTATDETFAGMDFYSVALHEMGHVLGLGTSDSWNFDITSGQFQGSAAAAVNAGPVPLDENDAHWAENTTSTMYGEGSFPAAMTPSLMATDRERFTDLDLAAMSDIGWEVSQPSKPGDADKDGDVDLTDFNSLKSNFSTGTTWAQGNFDGDSFVDLDDFNILKNNFTGGAGSRTIPEPATLSLLAIACLPLFRKRRR